MFGKNAQLVRHLTSGVVTSIIAALIMAVAIIGVFWFVLGTTPFYPVQVIGSAIFGEKALQGFHFGAFVAGLILHMIAALSWGIIFGLLANTFSIFSVGKAFLFGLLIGIASMIDVYVAVPTLMTQLHGTDIWNREVPMFWDWVAHLIFGASFGFYPKVYAQIVKNNSR